MKKIRFAALAGCAALVSMVACTGPSGADGNDGKNGADGKDGLDGSACWAEKVTGGFRMICGTDTVGVIKSGVPGPQGEPGAPGAAGADGANGNDGASCTATPVDGGFQLTCGGEVVGTIMNGQNGAPGEPGAAGQDGANGNDGASCSAVQIDGGIQISCGGEVVGTIMNGQNGAPGEPGAAGQDGADGQDGASCTAAPVDGGFQLSCGGEVVGTITNGQDGAPGEPGAAGADGADGQDGASCTAVPVNGGYDMVCDGASVGTVTSCTGRALENGIEISCGGEVVGVLLGSPAAATVGDRAYADVADALAAAAANGGTVTMASDASFSNQVVFQNVDVVIDLNGKTIAPSNSHPFYVDAGASLVIRDNGNGGKIVAPTYGVFVQNGGSFTLESGAIESVESAVVPWGVSTINIDGGTLTAADNCPVSGNGSNGNGGYTINITGGEIVGNIFSNGYASCGVYAPNAGQVNISGGHIVSTKGAGVVVRSGSLNVTGGMIEAQGPADFVGKVGDSRVVVKTAGIVVDRASNYPGRLDTDEVLVSGAATVSGSYAALDYLEGTDGVQPYSISGGFFNTQVPAGFVAAGYAATDAPNAQGYYTVVAE